MIPSRSRHLLMMMTSLSVAYAEEEAHKQTSILLKKFADAPSSSTVEEIYQSLNGVSELTPEILAELRERVPAILDWLGKDGADDYCDRPYGAIASVLEFSRVPHTMPFATLARTLGFLQAVARPQSGGRVDIYKAQKAIDQARIAIGEKSTVTGDSVRAFFDKAELVLADCLRAVTAAATQKLADSAASLTAKAASLAKVAGGGVNGARWHANAQYENQQALLTHFQQTLKKVQTDTMEKRVSAIEAAKLEHNKLVAAIRACLPGVDVQGLLPELTECMDEVTKQLRIVATTRFELLMLLTLERKETKSTVGRLEGFTAQLSAEVTGDWRDHVHPDLKTWVEEKLLAPRPAISVT